MNPRSALLAVAALALSAALPLSTSGAAITDPTVQDGTGSLSGQARELLFKYEVSWHVIPRQAKSIGAWVPLPRKDNRQDVSDLILFAPGEGKVDTEPEYGNQFFFFTSGPRGGQAINITIRFRVKRYAIRFEDLDGKLPVPPDPPENLARYLEGDRLAPIDAEVKALAGKITQGKATPAAKARAVYDYVVDNIKFDRRGKDWGQGDLKRAINVKKGNSLDIATAFVGLARAAGVPARLAIGFKLPAREKKGILTKYHAWTEFWLDGLGWVPADPSDGVIDPQMKDRYFAEMGPDRIQFGVGRDVTFKPAQKGEPLNYMLYPYGEAEGAPLRHTVYRFSFEPVPPPEEPEAAASN